MFSTRPTLAVEGVLGEWGRSCRLSLLPFDTDERIVWVRKHCPEAISALVGFERDYPQHAGFLDTPLLFAMVLSALTDEELADLRPFRWDLLPGRAGLLQGFVAYALARAVQDGRITEAQRNDYEEESSGVVQGAFRAALTSGQQDRFPRANVEAYLSKAFGDVDQPLREAWKKGRDILLKAGLLHDLAGEGAWGVVHQQFGEYWAARHLASRLDDAFEAAWLEAELWDHLSDMRLDPVVGQALAVVSAKKGGSERLQTARQCLTSLAVYDRAMILAEADRDSAVDLAFQALQGEDSELRWRAPHALARIGGSGVIGRLIACLRHDSEDVRRAARATLVGLGHELVTDDQVALLKDPSPSVRIAATEALGATKDKSALKSLIGCLEDPDWVVQRRAAEALGRLGSRSALKALVTLASNPARVAAPAPIFGSPSRRPAK